MRPCLLACVLALAGCDQVTFYEPQPQKISQAPFERETDATYAGETISVYDQRGNIEVVGVPGLETVRVTAWPSADAASEADAQAAFADVEAQFVFSRTEAEQGGAVISVACNHAERDHGKVSAFSTGCERLLVEVPTGSPASPVRVSANAVFGSVRLRDVTGSVTLSASYAMIASVTPLPDGQVSIISRPDSTNIEPIVAVALPSDFCAKEFRALAFGANHHVEGSFPWLAPDVCAYPYTYTQPIYADAEPVPCLTGTKSGCQGLVEIANTHGNVSVLDQQHDVLPWDEIP